MYTASNHSAFMGLMTTVMSLLMFVVSANAACNPIPTMTEFPGSDNITLSQQYDIEFLPGGGSDTCGPTVFKCDNSSLSLVLKSFTIKTKKMIKFEQFIVVDKSNPGIHVISFGDWNIPRSYGADNFVYTYTPDFSIVGNGSLGVEATVVISSLTPIPPKETTVEILFQCRKIDPEAIPAPVPHEEYATLTSRFQVYVLPVVITFLLFMLGIIRRCSPYAMAKLKSFGDFTEEDEEEIKSHVGGGTWLDHIDDVVTDLKSRGVCEKRADMEEEEMKGVGDSDDDSSNSGTGSGSGSDPISATKDSVNTSNSGSSHSMESGESGDENTEIDALDDEGSSDVNSDEDS